MKKLFILLFCLIAMSSYGQDVKKGYEFTTVKENKITPVKNQNRSGTCWSFSGIGLLESELLRKGKGELDLSEMFVVHHSYTDKADKYVRMHGKTNFAGGGSFHDVLYVLKHYGVVPEQAMPGLEYGESGHVHGELDHLTLAYANGVIANPNKKLSPVWKKGFEGIVNAYLGACPETFTYNGKQYTPTSFATSLGLNADDYVSLTSFTHHPFHSSFSIEIPDNWRWGLSYNIPLNELMSVIDNAINKGYTVAWGADVSEKGFTGNGIAIIPDMENPDLSGSDQARWTGLSKGEKEKEIAKLIESPCKELTITQELRQEGFDNYQTTDDHGMLIYGIAKDQTGKKYYMVKNSWGENTKYKGTWYASEAFVAYKTINIIVHKDVAPKVK